MLTVPLSHDDTEGDDQNRRPVDQPAGSVQEQQQEAGSCQVLQFPGSEEAAGGGARPGGAVQRHRSYARTSLPHHLENTFYSLKMKKYNSTLYCNTRSVC